MASAGQGRSQSVPSHFLSISCPEAGISQASSAQTPSCNPQQGSTILAFINENYLKLQAGYLFPEIGRRVKAFADANPAVAGRIIRCGIGDVTEPLPAACIAAMHKAVDEMGVRETFRGYGPEQGYDFLRNAIAENDYSARGLDIEADEIFVSDGSK